MVTLAASRLSSRNGMHQSEAFCYTTSTSVNIIYFILKKKKSIKTFISGSQFIKFLQDFMYGLVYGPW